jgi:hypothetical protein
MLKNTHNKNKVRGMAQSIGPEFKPHTAKKKKKSCTFILKSHNEKEILTLKGL